MPAFAGMTGVERAGRWCIALLLACGVGTAMAATDTNLQLHYNKPATSFNEALPLGNGRIGVMVYGG
ncbi:MAG TPA: glycoside hydrolase N-terminal domain-containing protein, partial [Rhodanobacter sp.]|nr:glycoside hydrolase N-terminal domain-containing protein [Rhodanobacter sp.]